MNNINCPYCDGQTKHYLTAKDINRKTSNVEFNLEQCQDCSLLFVSNAPKNLGDYYQQDYHYVPKDLKALERDLPGQQSKIDILLPYKSSGDLLEIGPSVGYFCLLSQKAGFNVSAIEMDAACVAFLNDVLGVHTIQSDDPAQILKDNNTSYDAICMWHSIEHMSKPWEVFENAARRLNSEGVFLIAAPNPYSRQAQMMGKHWPHHDLPRHLFGMSMEWLEELGKKSGLEVILKTTRDKESLYWNRFSWAMKIKPLTRFLPSKLQSLCWSISIKLAKIFSFWEDKEGEGACYVMILRKP